MWKLGLKIFGIAGVVAFLIWVRDYYWFRPEIWNGTAAGYVAHVGRLTRDSTALRGVVRQRDSTIAVRDSIIAKKDTAINILTSEARKAQDYADTYLSQFNSAVAKSDADADRLSTAQTELAYYKALVANGTLSPLAPVLSPSLPEVLSAGLKTANREAIGRKVIDSLAINIGQIKAVNQRYANRLRATSAALGKTSAEIRAKATGGIPIIRHRRIKQLTQAADSVDRDKKRVDEELALEKLLNKQ